MKKISFAIAFAGLTVSASACNPGQIFGPPTAVMSIQVTSRIPGDTLTVFVNGDQMATRLTDRVPTHLYRVRVQVYDRGNCGNYCGPDYGSVHVSAWSDNLGRMSRVMTNTVTTDQVASFEFSPYDF